MILLLMKVWPWSPSLGNTGSQTLMPWAPQYSHRLAVRWGLSGLVRRGNQIDSQQVARTVGKVWKDSIIHVYTIVHCLHYKASFFN